MPDLTPAARAVLVQIVLGSVVLRIPSELLVARLVRAEVLRGKDGWCTMAFVATKAGRMEAARIGSE
jgi:hypothetical protein